MKLNLTSILLAVGAGAGAHYLFKDSFKYAGVAGAGAGFVLGSLLGPKQPQLTPQQLAALQQQQARQRAQQGPQSPLEDYVDLRVQNPFPGAGMPDSDIKRDEDVEDLNVNGTYNKSIFDSGYDEEDLDALIDDLGTGI